MGETMDKELFFAKWYGISGDDSEGLGKRGMLTDLDKLIQRGSRYIHPKRFDKTFMKPVIPGIHKILTELMAQTPLFGDAAKTAITNAAEQIEEQQRERVEKLREALLDIVNHPHVSRIFVAKAALKELDTPDA